MQFPQSAPCANPVYYRTYSRATNDGLETPQETLARATQALIDLGDFTLEERDLILKSAFNLTCLPSGRWLWTGGTKWLEEPNNVFGSYNCSTTNVDELEAFHHLMNLAMQGCGTGANLEKHHLDKLPSVVNYLDLEVIGEIGAIPIGDRLLDTTTDIEVSGDPADISVDLKIDGVRRGGFLDGPLRSGGSRQTRDLAKEALTPHAIIITVGDSRQGWCDAYLNILNLSCNKDLYRDFGGRVKVLVDVGHVRPAGEKLKGFGGVANPIKLPNLFPKIAAILNQAKGRKLNSVEACLLIDEAALVIVAGNIRRSAGLRLFSEGDAIAANAKKNLWQQIDGKWVVDPARDALRMANHTRAFHHKPDLETCIESVRSQYYSGEGAILWAGEAVARANRDLLHTPKLKAEFLKNYPSSLSPSHQLGRYSQNPCVTGDTWVFTSCGLKQVKDLVGIPFETRVNDKFYPSTSEGFFSKGIKPVYELRTKEGYNVRATGDHKFVGGDRPGDWLKLEELTPGSKIHLHDTFNNRQYPPRWHGIGDRSSGVADRKASLIIKNGGYSSEYAKGYLSESLDFIDYWQDIRLYGSAEYLYFLQEMFLQIGVVAEVGDSGGCDVGGVLRHFSNRGGNLPNFQPTVAVAAGDESLRLSHARELANEYVLFIPKVFGFVIYAFLETKDFASTSFSPTIDLECYICTVAEVIPRGEEEVYDCIIPEVNCFWANGFIAHNCGEIIGNNLMCNLAEIHLNLIHPEDFETQVKAFSAGALQVCALLHHKFPIPRYQYSRDIDPIVGVSFTGLFDFFVKAFGIDWLKWWAQGRPATEVGQQFKLKEAGYLCKWKEIVEEVVQAYCDRNNLKCPNRTTTVQPAGTKSLLTGASPGWHPPKAQRFIRRITFGKNDPIAKACIDYGYKVVPSQSDTDETGKLLDDPFDDRCTEWLVEIPVEVPWANIPGADAIAIEQFSALAQLDFYMQVQKYYTTHNCFTRKTEFLTEWGVRTFENFDVGDKVTVLNKDGNWVESEIVKTQDLRTMYEITIREGKTGKEKKIQATECHRFPTKRISGGDSTVKILTTLELKPGHRLVLNFADLPDIDKEGIRHGIAFNDSYPCQWRVISVTEMETKEYGWCVMEPKTNHFTLSDNILVMNTSGTIELRENEIEALGTKIYELIRDDEGYISVAMLARFDDKQTYPRLPFEPIYKATYERLKKEVGDRRVSDDFAKLVAAHQASEGQGAAPCDSDRCLLPEKG